LEVEIKIELTAFFYVEGLLIIGKQGLSMDGRAAWGMVPMGRTRASPHRWNSRATA
jgi:hypothetical protein